MIPTRHQSLRDGEVTGADQVIGKTLYARTAVPLKSAPTDTASIVRTVTPGNMVGIVYSYLLPRPGRTNLYWVMAEPMSGREIYAEHVVGRYDFNALRAQGVTTTEERLRAEADANKPLEDKILDTAKTLAIVGIVVFAGVQVLPKLFSRSSTTGASYA